MTIGEADEAALVRLIATGDRSAFEELYRRTSPWLTVRLRRRCADEQVVAEVLQGTYLAVWRAADGSRARRWTAAPSAGCGRSRHATDLRSTESTVDGWMEAQGNGR
nr:hypothetical protein [Amycolatopsis antarctica]